MTPSSPPRFRGHDLCCVRGERLVFAGLAFALSAGGALVVVGPNGSGKSSLLRLMAGLLRPAAGTLEWDGAPVSADPEAHRARVHYVGHVEAVKPVLTAGENVAFWAAFRGADGAGTAAARALAAFGGAALAEIPGRFLSAGQRRRVGLARIVATWAPLWLLDEPATALDRSAVGHLREAIAGYRRAGGMVALATHADLPIPDAQVLEIDRSSPGRRGPPPEAGKPAP